MIIIVLAIVQLQLMLLLRSQSVNCPGVVEIRCGMEAKEDHHRFYNAAISSQIYLRTITVMIMVMVEYLTWSVQIGSQIKRIFNPPRKIGQEQK